MQQVTLSNVFRPFVNGATTGATAKAVLVTRVNAWLNQQEEKSFYGLPSLCLAI
ncbi:MAG: hypothetical protein ABIN97_19240 [Ginsengibacter sp.]